MKKICLQDYLAKKHIEEMMKPRYRSICVTCMHPEFSCYCRTIETFDPLIKFVILIHPIEYQRRIATGRMSHLILKNSELIRGHNFSDNERVDQLLGNKGRHSLILYPDNRAVNLSNLEHENRNLIFPKEKKLTVFVIDGTWATARQMMRQSLNLQKIPRVAFTPSSPSMFRVRKQPLPHCLSTIEAIHQFIELSAEHFGFDINTRRHDILLKAFNSLVERQLDFASKFV